MENNRLTAKRRSQGMCWLALYTAIFLCGAFALVLVMLRYKRTLVWNPDGVKQHYVVIGYIGQALRGLLTGQGLPMLKFTLGQGMDVLTTCSYYGYTDPLNLLSVLAQGPGIEWVYMATDFLRLYLAGLFFGLYSQKVGVKDGWAVGCSAAVYAFCGYFARMLGRHPYFINGGLYLPLLLLGVERILNGRKWLMFTLVAALMLVVNFYFAYMNTIMTIVYIVVRLAFRLRERGVKRSAGDGLMLLGAYLLGAALSAVVFLPILKVYLDNSRLGVEAGYRFSMLHYPLDWYRNMLAYAFSPWDSAGNYLFANFVPVALFGLMAFFTVRDMAARQTRVALALCLVGASVPMIGWLMNGKAYVSCRWSYGMALFVALGCALGLPALFDRKSRCRRPIAILALAYAALLAANCFSVRDRKIQLIAPLCIAVFAVCLIVYDTHRSGWLTERRAKALTSLFLAGTCALYILVDYLPMFYGDIQEQMKMGVYQHVASEAGGQLLDDEDVYRVAQGMFDDTNALILDYMGTSYYWSLVDGENSAYYSELNLPTQSTTYRIYNLGGSAGMNAVAGVKYFLQHDGERYVVPYGYEPMEEALKLPDGSTATVYENRLALPLGYAFDRTLPKAEYDALPVEEKLRALVSYAIVDEDGAAATVSGSGMEFADSAVALEHAVIVQDDAALGDGTLSGTKGGRIGLSFDAPPDGEVYLIIEGLDITSLARNEEGVITVESAGGRTVANVPHPNSNFYFPKRNYAFCLGSGALQGCEIVLDRTMEYSYDRIRVVSLPLSSYREAVDARRAESLTDINLGRDSLTGIINVSGDRVLQIAVPYNDGWRAWVDGVEQQVFHCGGLYMGLALSAGEHTIEMRYVTPGLKLGALISGVALALLAMLAVLDAVGRRRRIHE